MTHSTRTSEQHTKFNVLKRAINGFGEALDAIVNAFGSEHVFVESGLTQADPVITTSTTFEELYSQAVTLEGGLYSVHLVAFYEMKNPSAADSIQLRVLVNGTPSGEPVTRTAGAAADEDDFEHITFNNVTFPEGEYTLSIEGLVEDQGVAGIELHLTRFRVETTRIALSGEGSNQGIG